MSTVLALRLEFAMRSLEVASDGLTPVSIGSVGAVRDRIESMRSLVDQAIEELSA